MLARMTEAREVAVAGAGAVRKGDARGASENGYAVNQLAPLMLPCLSFRKPCPRVTSVTTVVALFVVYSGRSGAGVRPALSSDRAPLRMFVIA